MSTAASPVSDRETRWRAWVAEIGAGDAQALGSLYDETAAMLQGLALRIVVNPADAEEVLLDVFNQVWRRAKTFDPARGSVWRWLTVMTRSRGLDRLRAGAARREREQATLTDDWEVKSEEPLPDECSMFQQQQIRVRRAVAALPREQREALELAYFKGLTHSEIAEALSVPLGTIKTRIRMAMEKLRVALAEAERSAAGSIS